MLKQDTLQLIEAVAILPQEDEAYIFQLLIFIN